MLIKKYFKPDMYLKNIYLLDLDKLKKEGITLLICDIDNTLVAHDEKKPTQETLKFIQKCNDANIELAFISNNNESRVCEFACDTGIAYYSKSLKPLKRQYKRILNDYNKPINEVCAAGDQLLTDVFGAKRMRIKVILTEPLFKKDIAYTKINRIVEHFVFKLLERKGYLIRGNYYE